MSESVIREATAADAARLATVYRSAYRENRDLGFPMSAESVTEADLEDWIRDYRLFVAERDDCVVGAVRLEPLDDAVKLSRLAVHPDWSGEGIGTRLVDYAEQKTQEWGYDTIRLTTPPEHPYLPDFYRERGYEETEPYPLEYRDYDEVVMEKELR
jgi:predicted N-acetyltransferase YhbS